MCELRNWTRVLRFGVRITCRAFGLWDGPGLPLLLPVRTCNTVFLASWACSCRASCRLANPVPEIFENSRVGVPTEHWSMLLFWHPDFRLTVLSPRCPRCTFHSLDEGTVPDFLIILRSNRPCYVPSQMPGMNRQSNVLRSVSLSADFRIKS